jgi:methanogenic corrinoid protein MtbC1
VRFAEEQGLQSTLTDCGPDAPEVWAGVHHARKQGGFLILRDLVKRKIDLNDSMSALRILLFVESQGISVPTILDEVIGGILVTIGEAWISGETDIGEEHRMTQQVVDLLQRIRLTLPPHDAAGAAGRRTAVVGCLPGGRHEMGSLMVRLLLEQAGWKVVYLGADTPVTEFAKQQALLGAEIVATSVVPPQTVPDVRHLINELEIRYDSDTPFHLVLGGSGLETITNGRLNSNIIESVKAFSSMADFSDWLSSLGVRTPVESPVA